MNETVLQPIKALLYHVVCLGDDARYLRLKGRLVLCAGRLGAYERACMQLLEVFVTPGSTAIDAGAGFGVYTHRLAALVGPAGRVLAFEPVPPVADALERSCAGLPQVSVYREALSNGERRTVGVRVPRLPAGTPEPALAQIVAWSDTPDPPGTWRTFQVPAEPLDNRLADLRNVTFLKADVEGHEAAFLEGARATIRAFRPAVQVECGGIARAWRLVAEWARDERYAIFNLRRGHLCPAPGGEGLSLNVYLLPAETVASLPGRLLAPEAVRP
jgi:FkbM family methyltransferase